MKRSGLAGLGVDGEARRARPIDPQLSERNQVDEERPTLAEQVYGSLVGQLKRQVAPGYVERNRQSQKIEPLITGFAEQLVRSAGACQIELGIHLPREADDRQLAPLELREPRRVERGRGAVVRDRDEGAPHAQAPRTRSDGVERVAQDQVLDRLRRGRPGEAERQ